MSDRYGTMVKSQSGYPIQSSYITIANRQAEIMMRIASEFGLTQRAAAGLPRRKPQNWIFLARDPNRILRAG